MYTKNMFLYIIFGAVSKDIGIVMAVFDTYLPHVAMLTLIYLTFNS